MNTRPTNLLPTIIVISAGLLAALWWAVMPARVAQPTTAPVASSSAKQCPPGSKVEGKLCVCAAGSRWTGSECTVSTDDLRQSDTRHVTTVDLRRR
jgi:opacity protein-like surface antigen